MSKVKESIPIIAIIINKINKEVNKTIDSLLSQTFPLYNILLTSSEEIDEKYKKNNKVKIVKNIENELNDYEYILTISSSTTIDKTFLETAYFSLECHKEAIAVYGTSTISSESNKELKNQKFNELKDASLINTKLIRRQFYTTYKSSQQILSSSETIIHIRYITTHYDLKYYHSEQVENINCKIIEYPRENYNWDKIVDQIDTLKYPIKDNKHKTNILMIIPWMIMGGADKFNLDFARLINKDKYNIYVITTVPHRYVWRNEFEKYVNEVFDISTFLDEKYWNIFINYIIKTRNINLIFNTNSIIGYISIPYIKAKFPEIPIIDYIHAEEWYNRNGGYSRDSSAVNTLIDKTLFCNRKSQKIYIDKFNGKKEKTDVVYIGVDSEKFNIKKYNIDLLKKKYNIKENSFNIGYICRIGYEKRPFLLVEIIKRVVAKDKNTNFLIGGDGPLLEEMKNKINALSLSNNVKFLGRIEQPQEFYSICDITINCSVKEGLALTTYESLSMGVPVISSDVGDHKVIIKDDAGVIVPLMQEEIEIKDTNYKEEEILPYVSAVFKVKENINNYKTIARKRIVEEFSLNNMIENMEKIIDKTIANPSKEAFKNGLSLSKNIEFVKEYINYFLLGYKQDIKYLCDEYERSFITDNNKQNFLKKLAIKFHLHTEAKMLKMYIKSLLNLVIIPVKIIIHELRKIINFIRRKLK